MSEERIAAIRARAEAATPWPWRHTVNGFGRSFVVADERDMPFTEADARFIAHARDDVPFLLTELENHTAVIRHLKGAALTMREMRDEAQAEVERLRAASEEETTRWEAAVMAHLSREHRARVIAALPGLVGLGDIHEAHSQLIEAVDALDRT